jgi:Fe-S cluster biogenesis protein NfuA
MMNNEELKVCVENALAEIRPFLEADGGNISLVSITKDVVSVQLEGACLGCSVNQMTLKNGVEATIKKYAPQIKRVVEVNGIKF